MTPPLRSLCCALTLMLCAANPAFADKRQSGPEALAQEGLGKIVRALELMLLSIPQYEKPEINKHGDIIIRRKRTRPERRLPDPKRTPPAKPKAI
jgi:hypothetical protein